MSTPPLVTVVVPTRNRAALLRRAVESVLRQTVGSWELVIVDDASTDGTADLIAAWVSGETRIRSVRSDERIGGAAARNRGIAEARGEFVAFLDDDDDWLPRRLEAQLEEFGRAGDRAGVVHGPYFEHDGGTVRLRTAAALPARDARLMLLRGNRLGHSTALVRRSVLERVGGFDERLPRLQDWDLWIRLAGVTGFAAAAEPVARIHGTPGSISTRPDALRHACGLLLEKARAEYGAGSAEAADHACALGLLMLRNGIDDDGVDFVRAARPGLSRAGDRCVAWLIAHFGPTSYRALSRLTRWWLDRRAAAAARARTDAEPAQARPVLTGAAPLVSIVIPAFNARRWVCEAIESALAQTYPHTEVILVDDGSTDGTAALARERFGARIRCHAQTNHGLAAARNAGLALARGRYIQFLDADDLLLPEKIASQVEALERNGEFDIAYCDFAYFETDPAQRTRNRLAWRMRSGDVWASLLAGNFIVVHAALVRKQALDDAGGFDVELTACEDHDLWLRLAARGHRFLQTPGVLALYRRTPGSMSSDRTRQIRATVTVLARARRLRPLSTAREHLGHAAFRLLLIGMSARAALARRPRSEHQRTREDLS